MCIYKYTYIYIYHIHTLLKCYDVTPLEWLGFFPRHEASELRPCAVQSLATSEAKMCQGCHETATWSCNGNGFPANPWNMWEILVAIHSFSQILTTVWVSGLRSAVVFFGNVVPFSDTFQIESNLFGGLCFQVIGMASRHGIVGNGPSSKFHPFPDSLVPRIQPPLSPHKEANEKPFPCVFLVGMNLEIFWVVSGETIEMAYLEWTCTKHILFDLLAVYNNFSWIVFFLPKSYAQFRRKRVRVAPQKPRRQARIGQIQFTQSMARDKLQMSSLLGIHSFTKSFITIFIIVTKSSTLQRFLRPGALIWISTATPQRSMMET